jgi:hypothetical protein
MALEEAGRLIERLVTLGYAVRVEATDTGDATVASYRAVARVTGP